MSTEDLEKLDLNENADDLTEGDNNMYGYVDKTKSKETLQPRVITLKMILDRNLNQESRAILKSEYEKRFESINLPQATNILESEEEEQDSVKADKAEQKAMQLLKLTHIHLDREQIGEIDNLAEYLGDVTNLYLQGNLIKRIENLEFLTKLKFLILSNNQIKRIENLTPLKQLKLLDLSYNLIENIDVEELPKQLVFLDLRFNECFSAENTDICTQSIVKYLTNLKQLNGQDLLESSGDEDNDDDDDDQEKTSNTNETVDLSMPETFKLLSERIIERSRQRQIVDASDLDEISKERRIRMDQARESIDANIKNAKKL